MKPKSVLLKTSTIADVVNSGGTIAITGLDSIREADIIAIRKATYKAEVVQVATLSIAGVATSPTASTVYTIQIGEIGQTYEGARKGVKAYSYTTPAVITDLGGTAALQWEAINAAIIADINADPLNYVVAATTGSGTGMTITDDAGYYPANILGGTGRQGFSFVSTRKAQGSSLGYVSTDLTITTAGVYAFGDGTRMAQDQPSFAIALGGNMISGRYDAPRTVGTSTSNPTFATAGQKYDAYLISTYIQSPLPSISGFVGLVEQEYIVWVDNGQGSATTNRAGYLAFSFEMDKLMFKTYANDLRANVLPFESYPVNAKEAIAGATVVQVTTTTLTPNVARYKDGKEVFYTPIGTATLFNLLIDSALPSKGAQVSLDLVASEGNELALASTQNVGDERLIVVGTNEGSIYARCAIGTVANTEDFYVGFRIQGTATVVTSAGVQNVTEYACIRVALGAVTTLIRKASGAVTTATPSPAIAVVDGQSFVAEVKIDKSGLVSFFFDGRKIGSTTISMTAAAKLIPYIYNVNNASGDAAPFVRIAASYQGSAATL